MSLNPSDWDTDPDNNTSINGNNIDENCPPSTVNNGIRCVMSGVANLGITEKQQGLFNFRGNWVDGTLYAKNDGVLDEGWTMQSLVDDNDERAGIFPSGSPFYIYQGASPTNSVTAKQLLFGTRYTASSSEAGYLTGWRCYTIAGNVYSVSSVANPLTAPVINQLITFTANVTGWTYFSINPVLMELGLVFDMVVIVQEPDPSPTTFTGPWNYTKPNNPTDPLSGQITHSNKELSILRVHKTDNLGADRSAELLALLTGDVIQIADGTRWSIQTLADNTTYVSFVVAPPLQDPLTGIETFTFETVTATPITHVSDTDYWTTAGSNHRGLFGIDTDYDNVVPDNNAYGVDVQVQYANLPTQWRMVAPSDDVASKSSGDVSGGGSSGLAGVAYQLEVFEYANLPAPIVGGIISVPDAPGGPVVAIGNGTGWHEVRTRNNPL